jgi:hypothetical protein
VELTLNFALLTTRQGKVQSGKVYIVKQLQKKLLHTDGTIEASSLKKSKYTVFLAGMKFKSGKVKVSQYFFISFTSIPDIV